MPAYNAAATIASSMDSVLGQTFTDWELIIIDDASSDNTPDIISQHAERDSRIFIHTLRSNGGLSNARNLGCKYARGEFIAFLDSDDLWYADKLEVQMRLHLNHPEIDISHADFTFFNDQGIIRKPFRRLANRSKKAGYIFPEICYSNNIGVLTVILKKNVLDEVGYFDTSLWTMEDQDLWVRIASNNHKFGYIDRPLAKYRISAGSLSSRTGKYKRAYRAYISKQIERYAAVDRDELWRIYYRYFGAIYFNRGQYTLARCYLKKSILIGAFNFSNLLTILYLVRVVIVERYLRLLSLK